MRHGQKRANELAAEDFTYQVERDFAASGVIEKLESECEKWLCLKSELQEVLPSLSGDCSSVLEKIADDISVDLKTVVNLIKRARENFVIPAMNWPAYSLRIHNIPRKSTTQQSYPQPHHRFGQPTMSQSSNRYKGEPATVALSLREPPDFMVYYSLEQTDLIGLNEAILKNIPGALQKITTDTSDFAKPCVIISFLTVDDGIDPAKWIPVFAESRRSSDKHHLVVLVHDNARPKLLTAFLPWIGELAAEIITARFVFDVWGKPPKQIFLPTESTECFASIRNHIQSHSCWY